MGPGTIVSGASVWWRGLSGAGRARAILAVLGAALAAYLVFGVKPWQVFAGEGKELKTGQFVQIYFWWASVANLVIAALLALSAPWWVGTSPGKTAPLLTRTKFPGWFKAAVLAAMAVSAWIGWPRLGQSLWHDEAYPVRRAFVGEYKIEEDGAAKLRGRSWTETLFYFKKPNHLLHSAICRVFNDAWRTVARPRGLQFSETAIRLPTYFAGIAAVGMLAWLLGRMGFVWGGAAAAFLAALHPWYVRYTTEARSYAFVLLLVPALVFFLLKALDSGKWKWWASFAAGQFALLYFYLTCVYVLLALNLAAIVALAIRWKGDKRFWPQTARWAAANAFAAMATLAAMLPCIPQFLEYLKETYGRGQVDWRWTQNLLSFLVSGTPWNYSAGLVDGVYVEMAPWAAGHPGLMVLAGFLGAGGLALGIWAMAKRGPIFGLMVLPLILPAVLCYAEARARNGHMYEWYVIFVLPGVVGLAAVGLASPIDAAKTRAGKVVWAALLAACVAAFGAWTQPKRARLRAESMQPNRESVLLSRPSLDPNDPSQERTITATFFGKPDPYDPRIHFIVGNRGLEDVVREADVSGKALYINLGYLVTVEGEHGNKYRFLKESGFFDDLGILRGNEPLQSRHVFRYRPGSATNFDFSTIPVDRGSPGQSEE